MSATPRTRSRLLDLCCGAGGCSAGYRRAGFGYILGIDHEDHPDYPFTFLKGDMFDVLADRTFLRAFDLVHISPPCWGYTSMSNRYRGHGGYTDQHDQTIPEVRALLESAEVAYVIENVVGARSDMRAPIVLCGGQFGLQVHRPRLFESNLPITAPPGPISPPVGVIGVYGRSHDGRRLNTRGDGTEQRAARTLDEGQKAMGIDWMAWHDLTQAIPPAYTEWIGREALFALGLAA